MTSLISFIVDFNCRNLTNSLDWLLQSISRFVLIPGIGLYDPITSTSLPTSLSLPISFPSCNSSETPSRLFLECLLLPISDFVLNLSPLGNKTSVVGFPPIKSLYFIFSSIGSEDDLHKIAVAASSHAAETPLFSTYISVLSSIPLLSHMTAMFFPSFFIVFQPILIASLIMFPKKPGLEAE